MLLGVGNPSRELWLEMVGSHFMTILMRIMIRIMMIMMVNDGYDYNDDHYDDDGSPSWMGRMG